MSESEIKIVSEDLQYKQKEFFHSQPQYTKIVPTSGSTLATLSASSVIGPVNFSKNGSQVYNFSKDYIAYDLTIPLFGATGCTWMTGNIVNALSRVVVRSQATSTVLADVVNVGQFCEIMNPVSTSMDELNSKSTGVRTLNETSVTSAQLSPIEDIAKCNSLINNVSQYPNAVGGGDLVANNGGIPYSGLRRLYSHVTGNVETYVSMKLPMSAFKHTFLSVDKLLYFGGSAIEIDLYFEAGNRYMYNTVTVGDPDASASALVVTPTVSNLVYYSYNEQNPRLIQQVKELTTFTGITLPIPYVYGSKIASVAATSHTPVCQIQTGHGKNLLFIAYAPFHTTESSYTCKSHTTYNLQNYNSYINSIAVTNQAGIDILKGEHYLYNKQNIKDSILSQSIIEYSTNFVHIDNFSGMSMIELAKNSTTITGLPITETLNYMINLTCTSTALNHYIFWVTQKVLKLTSQGVFIE